MEASEAERMFEEELKGAEEAGLIKWVGMRTACDKIGNISKDKHGQAIREKVYQATEKGLKELGHNIELYAPKEQNDYVFQICVGGEGETVEEAWEMAKSCISDDDYPEPFNVEIM